MTIVATHGGGPRLGTWALCRRCRYRLEGLVGVGRCPECGTPYPPVGGTPRPPPQSAERMCRWLAWPMVLLAGGVLIVLVAYAIGAGPFMGVGVVLTFWGVITSIVNGPAVFAMLCVDHAPVGRSVGNPLGHLKARERAAVLAALLIPPMISLAIAALVIWRLD